VCGVVAPDATKGRVPNYQGTYRGINCFLPRYLQLKIAVTTDKWRCQGNREWKYTSRGVLSEDEALSGREQWLHL